MVPPYFRNDTSLFEKGIQELITLKYKSKVNLIILLGKAKTLQTPKTSLMFLIILLQIKALLRLKQFPALKSILNVFLNNSSLNLFVHKLVTHDEVWKLVS